MFSHSTQLTKRNSQGFPAQISRDANATPRYACVCVDAMETPPLPAFLHLAGMLVILEALVIIWSASGQSHFRQIHLGDAA